MDDIQDLTKGSISKHIVSLSLPTSVGFFFHTMYNVVDTYFAGKISTDALAALSVSFPLFFLIIAATSGTQSGVAAIVSNYLGAGDKEQAIKYSGQSLSFTLFISFFITALGLLVSEPAFIALGASGEYLQLSLDYMNVLFLGSFLFIFAGVLNALLTASGDTKPYRNFLITGFFLNLILDPWFVYGGYGVPAMGVQGVAIATVLIQALGCLYMFKKAQATGLLCKNCFKEFFPNLHCYKELSYQSFPAALNMLTVSLGYFVLTYFISIFGQEAVAGFGIATRIEQIALLPCIGFNMAVLAIVGQNSGAGELQRAEQSWLTAIRYAVTVLVPGILLVLFYSKEAMGLFSSDELVISHGVQYLKIAAFAFWAYAILYISIFALQGLKRPIFGLVLGVFRQVIFPYILISFLIEKLDWGIFGVWWGFFIVTWAACFFTLWYTKKTFSKSL